MIYVLQDPATMGGDRSDFIPVDPDNRGEAPRCPRCHLFLGMLQWLPPHRVELRSEGMLGDILFGVGDDLLVSERFAALWQKEGLLGLSGFDDVEVVKVETRGTTTKAEVPTYRRVSVVRSDAAIDQQESGFEWERAPTCPVCRLGDNLKAWREIVLETPAKENIFRARGLAGTVLVDGRFHRFCEEHGISGVFLVPGSVAGHRY